MKISERLKSSIREGTPTIRYGLPAHPFKLVGNLLTFLLVLSISLQRQLRYSNPRHFVVRAYPNVNRVYKTCMIVWNAWPLLVLSSSMFDTFFKDNR